MTDPNSPAYPIPREFRHDTYDGLTKREHFAAMAMQGLLANPELSQQSYDTTAACAIKQADALLAALNKEESHE